MVYEPERMPVAATPDYINENVTVIKSFTEYLMPSEISSADELKAGKDNILRDGMAKIAQRATWNAISISARLCARILDVTYTGTLRSNAGIVLAHGYSSHPTDPFSVAREFRLAERAAFRRESKDSCVGMHSEDCIQTVGPRASDLIMARWFFPIAMRATCPRGDARRR